jgi:hypothetical protein
MTILEQFYSELQELEKKGNEKYFTVETVDQILHCKIDQVELSNVNKTNLKTYLLKSKTEHESDSVLSLNVYEMSKLLICNHITSLQYVTYRILKNLYDKMEAKNFHAYYFSKIANREIEKLHIPCLSKNYLKEQIIMFDINTRSNFILKDQNSKELKYLLMVRMVIRAFSFADIKETVKHDKTLTELYVTQTKKINDILSKYDNEPNTLNLYCDIYYSFETVKALIIKENIAYTDILEKYETICLQYEELTSLEKELVKKIARLAYVSSQLEQKYACFLDCYKVKLNVSAFLDIHLEDNDYGYKLKQQAEEFTSYEKPVSSAFQLLITYREIIPIEYRRDIICSINECITACKKTICQVETRIINATMIFYYFNEKYDCEQHKVSI